MSLLFRELFWLVDRSAANLYSLTAFLLNGIIETAGVLLFGTGTIANSDPKIETTRLSH